MNKMLTWNTIQSWFAGESVPTIQPGVTSLPCSALQSGMKVCLLYLDTDPIFHFGRIQDRNILKLFFYPAFK